VRKHRQLLQCVPCECAPSTSAGAAGSPDRYVLKRAGPDCRQWLYRCSPPAIVEIATLNASALLVIYLALYIYYIHRRAPLCALTLPILYMVTYLALLPLLHPQARVGRAQPLRAPAGRCCLLAVRWHGRAQLCVKGLDCFPC